MLRVLVLPEATQGSGELVQPQLHLNSKEPLRRITTLLTLLTPQLQGVLLKAVPPLHVPAFVQRIFILFPVVQIARPRPLRRLHPLSLPPRMRSTACPKSEGRRNEPMGGFHFSTGARDCRLDGSTSETRRHLGSGDDKRAMSKRRKSSSR